MSIRIVIDNEDANDPGCTETPWTANVYDTERPDMDGELVAFGATPLAALTTLLAEIKEVTR
jgi:hypothetical protein